MGGGTTEMMQKLGKNMSNCAVQLGEIGEVKIVEIG